MLVTFILYYAFRKRRQQHAVLLLASVVFIGYYHLAYLLTAVGITLFTFYAGRRIHANVNTPKAGLWLWGSLVALIGFWLVARYYFDLFPLGISFYTFQALSYLIEIYWEEDPEDNFIDFSLYMLLFVKFLSGPIERAYDLLPQFKKARAFDYQQVVGGLKLVAWGVFLKLVIADRIGPSLDSVLNDVRQASGMQLLLATLLYPIQWTGPNARFQAATQLQPTVYFNVYGRTLAPLAYLIVSVGVRLCVHSTECFAAIMASLGYLCVAVGDVCQYRCVAWSRVYICLLRSFSGHSNHHRDPFGQTQRAPLQCFRTACRARVDDYSHLSVLCLVAAFLPYKFGFRRALYLSSPLRWLSFIGERVASWAFRLLLDCLCGGRCIDVCHRSSQCPT